jgi:hypothetical protein
VPRNGSLKEPLLSPFGCGFEWAKTESAIVSFGHAPDTPHDKNLCYLAPSSKLYAGKSLHCLGLPYACIFFLNECACHFHPCSPINQQKGYSSIPLPCSPYLVGLQIHVKSRPAGQPGRSSPAVVSSVRMVHTRWTIRPNEAVQWVRDLCPAFV